MGHSAEFCHIHSVNLASAPELLYKRVGYLATWLAVNPDNQLMYLVVSNLQRDMRSSSFLEVSCALTSAAKLILPELVSAINPEVVGLLAHPNALVRKKAVVCMQSFYRKSNGAVGDQKDYRTALCDRDPSVMGAALSLFHDVIITNPASQRDLIPSFVSILKQITEHRLSREFDYHRVPAPWLQIKLLKLLALLAADDAQATQKCVEVLGETLKRADTGLSIGHAVSFEVINTVTSIVPVPELIEAAADTISKFLTSNNANLKYLGITALSRIVKIDPKYAQEHQHIVIDCLEDPDDTIRRNTLSLLFSMCNENSVEVIIGRVIKVIAESTDKYLRQELARSTCDACEKYATNNAWYIETMNKLLEIAPEHVQQSTIQQMLKTIAEGSGDDEAEDAQFRTQCVENYFALAESPDKHLPPALIQVIAWVLGEYGFLTKRISRVMMLDRLCDLTERCQDASTRGWIITAMMKIVAHNGFVPENVKDVVSKLKDSRSVELQQRCYEFMELTKNLALMKKALPLDGCCEDIEVDESLSFLDALVKEALQQGAKAYEKKEVALGVQGDAGFKTEAYKTAQTNVVNDEELTGEKFKTEEPEKLIIKGNERRWGAKNLEAEPAVAPIIAPVTTEGENNEGKGDQPQTQHVDPLADVGTTRKPTKNEKFLSNIFQSAGEGKTRKTRKSGDRAKESQRRAEEAEAATRGMTTENQRHEQEDSDVSPPVSAPVPPPTAQRSSPLPAGGSAPNTEINIQKQLGPDCLRVRVGVRADKPLSRVSIQLNPPPNCALEIATKNITSSNNLVTVNEMPAAQPFFLELVIKAKDYPQGGALSVNVSYGCESGPGSKAATLPLGVNDLLRPAQLTTEIFGQNWPKHSAENKVQLRFPRPITPDVLSKHLLERASIKIIQVIGKECIAAAMVVPVGHLILAHMSVDGANVNVALRSQNKGFCDAVGRALTQGLK